MTMRLLFLRDNGYLFDSTKKIYWSDLASYLLLSPRLTIESRTSQLDPFVVSLLKGTSNDVKVDKLLHIAIASRSAFLSYTDRDGKTWTRKLDSTRQDYAALSLRLLTSRT